jgi:predicted nucleic acid-binding protein
MSEKYVIDAYAWIEYLVGSRAGEKIRSALEKETNEIYTCAVTVAEVVSKTAREDREFETAYDILLSNSQVVDIDEEISKEAGVLHCEMRKTKKDFGLADAYVLAVARTVNAKILTGDPHFRGVKEAVLINERFTPHTARGRVK